MHPSNHFDNANLSVALIATWMCGDFYRPHICKSGQIEISTYFNRQEFS